MLLRKYDNSEHCELPTEVNVEPGKEAQNGSQWRMM